MAPPTTAHFDISPEKEASKLSCMRRQLFTTPPLITTEHDGITLAGKTAIITGSNGGIGLECARQLLDLGVSKLILTGRDDARNEAALKDLNQNAETGRVELWKLDMLSYESITNFVERASHLAHLDMVVLNAGIFRLDMTICPSTGHEEDVQTNYLSTALMALLFLQIFKNSTRSSPGKIVLVSSDTAAWAKFKEKSANPILSAPDDKSNKWDTMERYATSKLLGQLFVTELAKHVSPDLAVVNMANPGLCHGSGLGRHGAGTVLGFALNSLAAVMGRTPSIGARAIVDAAVRKGPESHGQYCEDGKIRPMAPLVYKAETEEVAQRLWAETMKELSRFGADAIIREISQ
ncbi:short-chain dehydrogenase [Rhypophila decipiens]|uniref:Short-chain dehydrogenase n=1 Tax=Rhypophila decipiens TaxID=261697 RepID=A0AAN6Y643_9PEZI|nr:short-chain dehydrogenase [Rhypophila decipiens]